MLREIKMPKYGQINEEVNIVSWEIKEQQAVKKGEILLTVESDKAVNEIECPFDGVLTEIKFNEGEDVTAGDVIAYIDCSE